MDVTNLCDAREFADTIGDRVWRAWWRDDGIPLSVFQAQIAQMGDTGDIPLAFAAHEGAQYLGSVLLIENDLAARPQYRPWIAALWVEPKFRSRGIAGELIRAARSEARRLGFPTCYLCATEANSPYYEARGYQMIERSVAGLNVFTI